MIRRASLVWALSRSALACGAFALLAVLGGESIPESLRQFVVTAWLTFPLLLVIRVYFEDRPVVVRPGRPWALGVVYAAWLLGLWVLSGDGELVGFLAFFHLIAPLIDLVRGGGFVARALLTGRLGA